MTVLGFLILLPRFTSTFTLKDIIVKLLDLVTITVSPVLPAVL